MQNSQYKESCQLRGTATVVRQLYDRPLLVQKLHRPLAFMTPTSGSPSSGRHEVGACVNECSRQRNTRVVSVSGMLRTVLVGLLSVAVFQEASGFTTLPLRADFRVGGSLNAQRLNSFAPRQSSSRITANIKCSLRGNDEATGPLAWLRQHQEQAEDFLKAQMMAGIIAGSMLVGPSSGSSEGR
eukprot:767261-Rhodomonas_salina.1